LRHLYTKSLYRG